MSHNVAQARDYLTAQYYDFINNYLTIEKYAEHNGITVSQACEFMALAEKVADSPHPES